MQTLHAHTGEPAGEAVERLQRGAVVGEVREVPETPSLREEAGADGQRRLPIAGAVPDYVSRSLHWLCDVLQHRTASTHPSFAGPFL
eukprot:5557153-Amphidinium_carterae.1